MFECSSVTSNALPWECVAQGAEPEAIMMCRINVHGVAYALHAFRVAMPFSAGWTSRMSWEDDKHALGSGVLWHSRAAKEYIRAVDAGIASIAPEIPLQEDEREWNIKWIMLSRVLGMGNGNRKPSKIGEHYYYITGVSVGTADPSYPTLGFTVSDRRRQLENIGSVCETGLLLENGACDFIMYRVRNIEGHIRAFSEEAAEGIRAAEPILSLLDGKLIPMNLSDGWWTGIIVPADMDEWAIDVVAMTENLSENLDSGRIRWLIQRHDRRFDAFDARLLENLAERCRERRLALNGTGMWLVMSMRSLLGEVGFGRNEENVKGRLFNLLSKTLIRGTGRNAAGYYARKACIAERIYIFEDAISIQVGNDFAWMANGLAPGRLTRLAWHCEIHETPGQDVPGCLPEWSVTLPELLDGRVTRFLAEWGGSTNL